MFAFQITAESKETRARAGEIQTGHGTIQTPVFMPVGTLGTVKSLSPQELKDCGVQIILGNTYHLYLRPGCEVIQRFDGLHRFMGWASPILTDSGGFQIFSLAKLAKITPAGATFQSHIDGSKQLLSPEKAIEIQTCLGSDILMPLDQCISYPARKEAAAEAVDISSAWAKRCKAVWEKRTSGQDALFGIVQGSMYNDLRLKALETLQAYDFNGYALGGLSVGEPKDVMLAVADFTLDRLPHAKPRYVMGVGTPADLVELVAQGADMFDCVMPTRNARNGQMFTRTGPININNARFRYDSDPIEPECGCYTCQNFSKAYLRHLYRSKELLAYRLNTIHNIQHYSDLMARMRKAIVNNQFKAFHKAFYAQMG